jgi:nitrogen fixation/metabolism regulation signal transduction histidine kinase
MSVLAPSRIPRSALFGSFAILLPATFAHAAARTALVLSIDWGLVALIVGILAGLVAIISGIIAGIKGIRTWLREKKKKWIEEAVRVADSYCQQRLDEVKRDIEKLDQAQWFIRGRLAQAQLKLTPVVSPEEQEQEAEAAKRNLQEVQDYRILRAPSPKGPVA